MGSDLAAQMGTDLVEQMGSDLAVQTGTDLAAQTGTDLVLSFADCHPFFLQILKLKTQFDFFISFISI